MELFLNRILMDLDDKEILDQDGKPATVRGIAVTALLSSFQDEQTISGEDKFKRWELAKKIKKSPDPIELTVEEVGLVKKLIGKAFAPVVSGQAWFILEGK